MDPPRSFALCVSIMTQNRGSEYEVELPRVRFLREQSYANVQGPVGLSHPAVRTRQIYSPNPRASATTSSSSAENKIRIGAQHTSQS